MHHSDLDITHFYSKCDKYSPQDLNITQQTTKSEPTNNVSMKRMCLPLATQYLQPNDTSKQSSFHYAQHQGNLDYLCSSGGNVHAMSIMEWWKYNKANLVHPNQLSQQTHLHSLVLAWRQGSLFSPSSLVTVGISVKTALRLLAH